MKDELKGHAKFLGISLAYWIIFLVLCVLTAAFFLWIRPVFLDLWAKQNQTSYEYITTVREVLVNDLLQWRALDAEIITLQSQKTDVADQAIKAKRAQQASLILDMRTKAARIPPGQVPVDVAQFLSAH